jgi:hypothetical protein
VVLLARVRRPGRFWLECGELGPSGPTESQIGLVFPGFRAAPTLLSRLSWLVLLPFFLPGRFLLSFFFPPPPPLTTFHVNGFLSFIIQKSKCNTLIFDTSFFVTLSIYLFHHGFSLFSRMAQFLFYKTLLFAAIEIDQ